MSIVRPPGVLITTIELPYVFAKEVEFRVEEIASLLKIGIVPINADTEAQSLSCLDQIIGVLRSGQSRSLALGQPITLRNGKLMAPAPIVYNLPNDAIQYYPIYVRNAGGALEPAIAGDTYSVTLGSPASQSGSGPPLNAVIGAVPATDSTGKALPLAGVPALVFNALNALGTGIPFSVSDADGLTAVTGTVNIVDDPTPVALDLGPLAASIPQAVPAA
jgi:hypothetical protein